MHDPTRCKAHTRKGGQCSNPPMRGQKVCRMHGGSTPVARAAAERRLKEEAAEQAVVTYGLPREVEPHQALEEELWRTAGHVLWLGMAIERLEGDEISGPVGGGKSSFPSYEPHVYIRMYQSERKHLAEVAKTCIAAGIEERRVRIAEEQGQLIARLIQGILADLGVADRPEVGRVVRKHLALVA